MVVRDEQRFLAQNLAYHKRLGVERFYIFLDRCSDRTPQIAAGHPSAVVLERDRRDDERFMSEFQRRCLGEALRLARVDGVDWLMHVDADEFARGDDPHRFAPLPGGSAGPIADRAQRASLARMLAEVHGPVEQVLLRPLDVLPTAVQPDTPFDHHDHFQNRGALRRRILDPTTGRVVRFNKRLGHYHGKAIVRVGDDVVADTAHRFGQADGRPLVTVRRGVLYHFIAVDGDLWWDKHRKFAEFPAHWEKGTAVRFPKQAWKQASVDMSREEARAYFDRWVAVSPRRLAMARLTGSVVRDDFVRRVVTQATPRGHRPGS